jgi:hypothetical protein
MIYALVLIFVSILSSPAFLVSRRPEMQKYIDKIGPAQGWIGVIAVIYGLWQVLQTIFDINIIDEHTLWWFSRLIGTSLITINGFLLGYVKLNKHIFSRTPETKIKADNLMLRLKPLERFLAVLGTFWGLWMLIAYIFFY